MAYSGSCHCSAVTFSVAADLPGEAISCNCSHCRRKGLLLTFVPKSAFALESGGDKLTEHTFYKHAIAHRFCSTCGVQSFAFGKGPDGSEVAAINLRAVPECDLDALELRKVDGASF
ncbi:GFA family protein [Parablastomonas sp. CN1-191]|uniref:GFA family protein n=1 Tax=Parablastomonas sp. CN1-191 TaxID=3400908 RepID=UPI003BF888B7